MCRQVPCTYAVQTQNVCPTCIMPGMPGPACGNNPTSSCGGGVAPQPQPDMCGACRQQNVQMCTRLSQKCEMTYEQVCQQVPIRVSSCESQSNKILKGVFLRYHSKLHAQFSHHQDQRSSARLWQNQSNSARLSMKPRPLRSLCRVVTLSWWTSVRILMFLHQMSKSNQDQKTRSFCSTFAPSRQFLIQSVFLCLSAKFVAVIQ